MKKILSILVMLMICVTMSAQKRYIIERTSPNGVNPMLVCTSMRFGEYSVDAMFDTGSTVTQLPYSDYVALKNRGIIGDSNFVGYVVTSVANGVVTEQKPKYHISNVNIGGLNVSNIDIVFDTKNKNNKHRLIGMNFIEHFDKMEIDFKSNKIIFTK